MPNYWINYWDYLPLH